MTKVILLSILTATLIGILSALSPFILLVAILILIGVKMPSVIFAILINGMFLLSYLGQGFFSGYQTIGTVSLVIIGTILYRDKKNLSKEPSLLVIAFFLFGSYISISLLWSDAPIYGLFKTQGYWLGTFLPLIALAVFARKDLDKLRTISMICIAFGLIATIFLVLENGFSFGSRASLDGVNTIWFGRYIGVALIFSYYYTFATLEKNKVQRGLWFLPTLILFASLLMNGSRGPLVAALIAILMIELVDLKRIKNLYAKITKIIALTFVVLGTIVLMLSSSSRLNYQNLLTDRNILERIEFIQEAIMSFSYYPLFGWGIGGFGIVSEGNDIRVYPHNFILEIGIELGIIGLLFLIVIFFLTVKMREYIFLTDLGRSWFALLVFFIASAMFSGDLFGNAIMWIPLAAIDQIYKYNKKNLIISKSM